MLFVDSNILLYPLLYDPKAVEEAGEANAFLLKVAKEEVEAYTSTLTWDEVVRVVRRLIRGGTLHRGWEEAAKAEDRPPQR